MILSWFIHNNRYT